MKRQCPWAEEHQPLVKNHFSEKDQVVRSGGMEPVYAKTLAMLFNGANRKAPGNNNQVSISSPITFFDGRNCKKLDSFISKLLYLSNSQAFQNDYLKMVGKIYSGRNLRAQVLTDRRRQLRLLRQVEPGASQVRTLFRPDLRRLSPDLFQLPTDCLRQLLCRQPNVCLGLSRMSRLMKKLLCHALNVSYSNLCCSSGLSMNTCTSPYFKNVLRKA